MVLIALLIEKLITTLFDPLTNLQVIQLIRRDTRLLDDNRPLVDCGPNEVAKLRHSQW